MQTMCIDTDCCTGCKDCSQRFTRKTSELQGYHTERAAEERHDSLP